MGAVSFSYKKYNSYFTLCKGYGIFDILQSLEEIKCPFCFIINKFSFFTDLGKDIYEFFIRNFNSQKDEIITINSNFFI